MKKDMIEEQKEFLIRMRNAILFTLAITSITSGRASANSIENSPRIESTLKKDNSKRNTILEEQIENYLKTEYTSLTNLYQQKIKEVNQYFEEQIADTRNMVGDFLLNKTELKEEEILPDVLNYYCMSEQDYNSLANQIIEASKKYDIHWNSREEITKMFYMSSTISNEKKLAVVLDAYQISYNEFMVYSGVVSAESKKIMVNGVSVPCYVDATAVATNINGRANSKKWSGGTVYSQVSRRGQYEVFDKNLYRKYINDTSTGYQAALDVMYHNVFCKEYGLPLLQPTVWLQFVSSSYRIVGQQSVQLVSKGNKFRGVQAESDLIVPYVPMTNPSEIQFRQNEKGEISIILPKVSTPNNAMRVSTLDSDIQELKLKM